MTACDAIESSISLEQFGAIGQSTRELEEFRAVNQVDRGRAQSNASVRFLGEAGERDESL